ncbi:uncharacterized protein CPUR_04401 [Claviceps purpurea 20.1]|uniref:Uncharacterized protein n=1 Tax=Claviceps purpurea (strain 20.1) TaxID=1111077 RepID=M1WAN6_CLAP2|nr:uncharacterized protein CPUR_04401 [Claviceps purpurea 20.1]
MPRLKTLQLYSARESYDMLTPFPIFSLSTLSSRVQLQSLQPGHIGYRCDIVVPRGWYSSKVKMLQRAAGMLEEHSREPLGIVYFQAAERICLAGQQESFQFIPEYSVAGKQHIVIFEGCMYSKCSKLGEASRICMKSLSGGARKIAFDLIRPGVEFPERLFIQILEASPSLEHLEYMYPSNMLLPESQQRNILE